VDAKREELLTLKGHSSSVNQLPFTGWACALQGVKRSGDVVVMQLEYTGDLCNVTDAMLTEMSHKFDGN
jgi:hypothetical protein